VEVEAAPGLIVLKQVAQVEEAQRQVTVVLLVTPQLPLLLKVTMEVTEPEQQAIWEAVAVVLVVLVLPEQPMVVMVVLVHLAL
jgi:hypothetical protein